MKEKWLVIASSSHAGGYIARIFYSKEEADRFKELLKEFLWSDIEVLTIEEGGDKACK